MSMEESVSKLSRLIKTIHTLTAPNRRCDSLEASESEDLSSVLIDKVLEENLETVSNDLQQSPQLQEDLGELADFLIKQNWQQSLTNSSKEISVREKHVEINLCFLHEVFTTLEALSKFSVTESERPAKGAPQLEPDSLSAPQIKTLTLALQFVVVLGVCPYLTPGVGLPVSQRLGPGQILLATACDYGTELSHGARVRYLVPPAKLMCEMLQVHSLRSILINNHLQDLLSLLFQLRFSTKNLQDQEALAPVCASHSPDDSSSSIQKQDCYVYGATSLPAVFLYSAGRPWTLPLVREHCNQHIDKAVRLSSTPHVLRTLMLLSGGGKSSGVSAPVKTPIWYKRTVAGLLRDVLMVPNGIQHLITLLVDESPSGHEWQRCKAMAQIVAQLPTTSRNVHQFHKAVTSQLLAILESSSGTQSRSVIRAVGATILELTNRQPSLMESMCFNPLFEPLLRISSRNETLPAHDGIVIVPETVLTSCVECLHSLYVLGQEPHSPLLAGLGPLTAILFEIFLAAHKGLSPLKSKCRDLIGTYLVQCEAGEAVRCILNLLSACSDRDRLSYPGLHRDVRLTPGQSGGLQAVKPGQPKTKEESVESWTQPVEALMGILTEAKVDDMIPHLFMCLLRKLTSIVKHESESASLVGNIVLPPRLMNSAQRTSHLSELREKVGLVSLLAAVGDKYGDGVVRNGGHVLEFVKATLERCVQICRACCDQETMMFEWETVSMAMALLTAVLSGGVDVGDQTHLLDELLPLLTFITDSEAADPRVKEMAEDLKVAVATKGLVWAELSQMKHSSQRKEDQNSATQGTKKKPLIEVLSETNAKDADHGHDASCSKNQAEGSASALEQALHELCDPLLPVRGHGLIALARLVEERSPEVETKQNLLLKVFLENLTHTDSYIYLASVNGLAALSDLCPDQVIPCLTSELQAKCADSQGDGKNGKPSGDLALKVGETLVKATRKLGELTPQYRDLLLPSILCGCRHQDPLTRASCLSGLAEVCQLLRFSLGPVLYEVVTCCRDVISSDPHPEPRKAAAMTFTLILRGLGKDTLLALDGALMDVYRTLKRALTNDSEQGVRTHAGLALEELDSIMREMLFAKPELSKRISILGLQ